MLLVESALSSALGGLHVGGSGEGGSRESALGHQVVGVGEAEIGVQHHLFVRSVGTFIDQLPLIFAAVATNAKLGAPSSSNQSMVVIVVENALVGSIRPMTIVARVGRGSASDGVSARDGSGEGPRIFATSVDVLNEDLLETVLTGRLVAVAAMLWVGHALSVPVALKHGGATVLEAIAELLSESSFGEGVGGIVASGSS